MIIDEGVNEEEEESSNLHQVNFDARTSAGLTDVPRRGESVPEENLMFSLNRSASIERNTLSYSQKAESQLLL